MLKIYHNPRCRKSREALDYLRSLVDESQIEVILYMQNRIDKSELKRLLGLLNISPIDLVRKGEKIFKENYKGKILDEEEWIDVLIAEPKLIERPIVEVNGKAVVARPAGLIDNIWNLEE